VAINACADSMAVHVLAHLALKNLKRRVWTREEVEQWLQAMDGETQQVVRDTLNEILSAK